MYAMYCKVKKGLTKAQKEAVGYYNFQNKEMDRYCESVFYIPNGSREKEIQNRINQAVEKCKQLNCGQYC